MHIPDGFLSAPVAAATGVVAVAAIAVEVKETNKKMGEKQVPMMGVLAAILLGPWTTVLILSSVLVVQCLIFQDGGLLALGANITNMGLIAGFTSYYIYKGIDALFKHSKAGTLLMEPLERGN